MSNKRTLIMQDKIKFTNISMDMNSKISMHSCLNSRIIYHNSNMLLILINKTSYFKAKIMNMRRIICIIEKLKTEKNKLYFNILFFNFTN